MDVGEKSTHWLHRESKPVFSKKPAHCAATLLNTTTTTTTTTTITTTTTTTTTTVTTNNNTNNTTTIAGYLLGSMRFLRLLVILSDLLIQNCFSKNHTPEPWH